MLKIEERQKLNLSRIIWMAIFYLSLSGVTKYIGIYDFKSVLATITIVSFFSCFSSNSCMASILALIASTLSLIYLFNCSTVDSIMYAIANIFIVVTLCGG